MGRSVHTTYNEFQGGLVASKIDVEDCIWKVTSIS